MNFDAESNTGWPCSTRARNAIGRGPIGQHLAECSRRRKPVARAHSAGRRTAIAS
jgi:hypothetical protein